jgi:tRNA modification GTPase
MDTIFALATARGKAGVAVIRISGPRADDVLSFLGGRRPATRKASLQTLVDPDGVTIDEVLVLAFDAGASFTGEPVIELHTHGSMAVINRLSELIPQVPDVALAEPGDFTRRALMNGRLDLAQVEGLADLIDAETEAQRRQAKRLFDGELSEKVSAWRDKLVEARALLEAAIDFADEEVPVDVSDPVRDLLTQMVAALRFELEGFGASERTRLGFEVALVGPPNAGKSTLLNALAGREAAITSNIAGTTRDVIEVRMDVAGLPVTFLDTAGLRETDDEVEAIGVRRTRERAQNADLRVFLVSGDSEADADLRGSEDIVLQAKADEIGFPPDSISGATGHGIEDLVSRVSGILQSRVSEASLIVNERQRQTLANAIAHLERAQESLEMGPDGYDIASEETRLATLAVRALVGDVGIEQVYDQIFSRFCIGK